MWLSQDQCLNKIHKHIITFKIGKEWPLETHWILGWPPADVKCATYLTVCCVIGVTEVKSIIHTLVCFLEHTCIKGCIGKDYAGWCWSECMTGPTPLLHTVLLAYYLSCISGYYAYAKGCWCGSMLNEHSMDDQSAYCIIAKLGHWQHSLYPLISIYTNA